MASASASSSNSVTVRTGPKISSRATRQRLSTPSRIVGCDVEAARLLRDPLAAGHDARALAHAQVDVAEDLLELAGVDDGAEARRGIERLAGRHSRPMAAMRSTSSSRTLRWTTSREPALQVWPLL